MVGIFGVEPNQALKSVVKWKFVSILVHCCVCFFPRANDDTITVRNLELTTTHHCECCIYKRNIYLICFDEERTFQRGMQNSKESVLRTCGLYLSCISHSVYLVLCNA
jgi:hypothetical protein